MYRHKMNLACDFLSTQIHKQPKLCLEMTAAVMPLRRHHTREESAMRNFNVRQESPTRANRSVYELADNNMPKNRLRKNMLQKVSQRVSVNTVQTVENRGRHAALALLLELTLIFSFLLSLIGIKKTKWIFLCIKLTIICSGTIYSPLQCQSPWSPDDCFVEIPLLPLYAFQASSSSSCSLSSEPTGQNLDGYKVRADINSDYNYTPNT